jgi:hypothetical protein
MALQPAMRLTCDFMLAAFVVRVLILGIAFSMRSIALS